MARVEDGAIGEPAGVVHANLVAGARPRAGARTQLLPLESRATAHRNARGVVDFRNRGATDSRPSLDSDKCWSVPRSKSSIEFCSQVLVSTTGKSEATHKSVLTSETNRMRV
jgi:hypothetical protein